MNAILTDSSSLSSPSKSEWPEPDLFKSLMRIMVWAEEAGNWYIVRRDLCCDGRWMVKQAIERKDLAALQTLAGLRDRLIAAMEYEQIHGEHSLRKMDHPQNILLADIRRSLEKNNPAVLNTVFPAHEPFMMTDWETYDFTEAMRKISAAGENL